MQKRERRHLGADEDLYIDPHGECVRDEDFGKDRIAQAVIAFVGDDADNLQPGVGARGRKVVRWLVLNGGNFERVTDRVAVGEVDASHGLVNDGDLCRVVIFAFVPNSALGEGNTEKGKVSGAYEVDANFLLIAWQLAKHFDGVCQPLAGGVALEEIAAMVTPGTVAARLRSCSK